jgi:hypothetical protein
MNHLTEEDLILHYYGEEDGDPEASRHIRECDDCRHAFTALQRVLNVVDSYPAPDPGAAFGERIWHNIERQLPVRRRWRAFVASWQWAAAATALAGLLVVAFLAGRSYPTHPSAVRTVAAADPQSGERVLLVAVGDYLERTQMVLIELSNAKPKGNGKMDISSQQERAGDLVSESRLYRQTAAHTGDTAVQTVLDELDRVLLDIAHSPTQASAADLQNLRERLESQGILFKIRVLGDNVRRQESSSEGRKAESL